MKNTDWYVICTITAALALFGNGALLLYITQAMQNDWIITIDYNNYGEGFGELVIISLAFLWSTCVFFYAVRLKTVREQLQHEKHH